MAQLMNPPDFERMLTAALTDTTFQQDMQTRGFKALDDRRFNHGVPPAVQSALERAIFVQPGGATKPKCGVCGVCGTCSLCGEVNFGSGSAALWALFGLSETLAVP
jgi:hypothetical protein